MSQADESLEARVQRLESREAILELKHRYLRACDAKDVETFRACFVDEGADIAYGRMGTYDDADGLRDIFERFALRRDADGYQILDMHHAVHPTIVFESPTAATGEWMLRFRQIDRSAGTKKVGAISYDDRYVWFDGQWRIQRSHAHELWSLTQPLPEGAVVTEHIDG